MEMDEIKYILFDAANTLIHKPQIWSNYAEVLANYGLNIDVKQLRFHHKLVSEVVKFPDITSKEFYDYFNSEVILSLGKLPTTEILTDLFNSCSYLPWVPFDDCKYLSKIYTSMGILSNFSSSLTSIISDKLDLEFQSIFISEELGVAKPNKDIFKIALNDLKLKPFQVLYIGDSLKLDIAPALSCGINVLLIDRDNIFPFFDKRISSFEQLVNI
jgi:FMN phosphatase YigB (HAD superfamily)